MTAVQKKSRTKLGEIRDSLNLFEFGAAYASKGAVQPRVNFVHSRDGYNEYCLVKDVTGLIRTGDSTHRITCVLGLDTNRPGEDPGDDIHPVQVVIEYDSSKPRAKVFAL